MMKATILSLIFVLAFAVPIPVRTSGEPDWQAVSEEAVRLMVEYLQVDTTNPPGNEARAVSFLARILEREGIQYEIFESAPGRANLYARIRGSGRKRPLILLNHTDVVPASREFWSVDPFGGAIVGGNIYGRGALDMKSLGLVQLMALILLKRQRVQLDRDVIFLATADEESGGRLGAGWFVKNHPELISDAEFLLTEGSSNNVRGGSALYYGIGVTEKAPCWIRLTARGAPGHGSVPRKASAPSRLIRALAKLESYETQLRVTPAVARYFRSIAEFQSDPELRRAYMDIESAIRDQDLRDRVLSMPQNNALLRNTIQPTVINVGSKTNVIAPIATAEVDCRLLPGQKPEDFVQEIKRVIADPAVEVEVILAFEATESPLETDLWRAIADAVRYEDRAARFIPTVLAGFTDSHFFRRAGIICYGFSPFLIPDSDFEGVHGNNERISVENISRGARLMYRIVHRLCAALPS
jgi:acetylornithine deacetylase/succinyl-diaminopimelate desuccinylase-like protein